MKCIHDGWTGWNHPCPPPSTCRGLEEPACCGECGRLLGDHSSPHPACGLPAAVDKVACCLFSSPSKHYPLYSLNVASMWLKLGRLYMGLENKAAGERALKKVCVWWEVRTPSAWWTPHTSLPAGLWWLTGSSRKTSPWPPSGHRSGRGWIRQAAG